jgi:hypothetical protein
LVADRPLRSGCQGLWTLRRKRWPPIEPPRRHNRLSRPGPQVPAVALGWKKLGLERSLGSRIVTYADDLVILCRRGKAAEALQRLREIMGKLKLTVNEEKTRICKVPEGEFDFLGHTFGRMFSARTGKAYLTLGRHQTPHSAGVSAAAWPNYALFRLFPSGAEPIGVHVLAAPPCAVHKRSTAALPMYL